MFTVRSLSLVALALTVACGDGIVDVPASGLETIELTRIGDGNLQYCDDAGTCTELPYAGACALVSITIDTKSGETCETCTDCNCEDEGGCDDDAVNPGEDCDGENLNGRICSDFGYAGGTLACTNNCRFDFSGCSP